MPTLHWIGKEKVVNHHQEVPYRVLEKQYEFNTESGSSENKIIQGDNLEALKSLLPEYEGRINCIYIDPPYNTGNENWVYNDNVNHPKIKKWLGETVGKEGEDLSRHDKWLCMMYPRLKLLHKLLNENGVIFISIDEFEHDYLHLIMDEIFGRSNRIETFVWKKTYGGGAKSKHVVNLHEYILFYAKDIERIGKIDLPPDESVLKYYKYQDEKFQKRGPYRLQPLATTSMDDRPNLVYPIFHDGNEIWPNKQWQWSKDRVEKALVDNDLSIEFNAKKSSWTVNYKQYLKDEEGNVRGKKMYSLLEGIYTQIGTNRLNEIFGKKIFNFPKPVELVQLLFQSITSPNSIILDSFAGSGTTAHAVLNLNKEDGGDRKFILIEMEDYADSITAERVRRVIQGYGSGSKAVEGTGGDFGFYALGPALFDIEGNLNEAVAISDILSYIWYSETRTKWTPPVDHADRYYLGSLEDTAYYFIYDPDRLTTLDFESLSAWVTQPAEQYICYADNCLLPEALMQKHRIIFKKIPRDITRF
ncbi:adenine-specific DNA-methyltransferase [Algoriphagus boseongensis]|uniref:site-specific DNA-methyltransferase (adenine-specific) n=1 Tax=Algoriphagus boseongensis TaxID=1442587 RepID=A0A4R6T3B5_9BACT|nr:site-specific DNA-methyltransferase [Algoriphagus boseongensis]TDQ16901.1 adenine-specific DNA-methyltransferase [Algoriphagus boseongensis]